MVRHRGRRLERPACHRDCPHIVAKPAARNQDVAGQRAVLNHPGKEGRRRLPFFPWRIAGPIALVPIRHGYKLQVAGWELRVRRC